MIFVLLGHVKSSTELGDKFAVLISIFTAYLHGLQSLCFLTHKLLLSDL